MFAKILFIIIIFLVIRLVNNFLSSFNKVDSEPTVKTKPKAKQKEKKDVGEYVDYEEIK